MLSRKLVSIGCVLCMALTCLGQGTGTIRYEVWDGIGGTVVTDLTNNPAFPGSPSWDDELTLFETPTNIADNFGGRVYGWLHPDTTGEYTFYIASDDASSLYLSTTESADDAVLIALEDSWAGSRAWSNGAEMSTPISLVAGQAYYIEALYKEGGGGDNLAVGWAMSSDMNDITVIDGAFLSPAPQNPNVLKARIVAPANGAVEVGVDAILEWTAGPTAVSHKVYLSADATIDDTDLIAETEDTSIAAVLEAGMTYSWRVDEVDADGVNEGYVWSFTVISAAAHFPSPADGGLWRIGLDTELSWTTGVGGMVHHIYISEDQALVDARDMSVANMYWPTATFDPGELTLGTTYYWAVDEFGPAGTVAGSTWSFKAFAFDPVAITDPSLLIHYGFEAGSGEMVNDLSGHENYGFLKGSPQWTNGVFGGGMAFDIATLDYVETGKPLGITSNTLTVSGWVKHDVAPAAWSGILTTRGSGNLGLQQDGTELRYMWGPDLYWDFSSGLAIPNGEWYFAALTVAPDQATLYLNGVDANSTTTNVAPHDPVLFDSLIRVARDHQDSRIMTSTIDDVRFYNRTLTAQEIVWAMNNMADITGPDDVVVGVPNEVRDGSIAGWPDGEAPGFAVDNNTGTKFLHFAGEVSPTGIQIAPAVGSTLVTGLTLTTANDSPERDPISYEVYGSNESIDGPYELIAAGDVNDFAQEAAWPRFTKNATTIAFDNDVVYAYYQVMFPAIRDAAAANSMQIAEVELIGVPLWTDSVTIGGDVEGDVQLVGDGVYEITGSGADVWGTSDQFHYLYKDLTGDGSISCRVTDFGTGSNAWAKGGVMIRETLDADSKHTIMAMTGGEGAGITFQGRITAAGASSTGMHSDITAAPPQWVKLTREGNTFTGYYSADGVAWELFTDTTPDAGHSNPIDVEMAATVKIGLFVTSHAAGELRTYTIDDVRLEGDVRGN